MSAALKVPKSTVASIVLKLKKFGTTGTGRLVRIEKTERSLMKTCSRVLKTSDWGERSPSNRTTTLSTLPRQRRSVFRTSL
ncbi:hypothetical protein J4Q44_G00017880 [Coregonus suidteri]|uniref:Uncharacterized protein n=1 Tax=Coregonus suidteri TaxID=861788 RepID=A0AAN8M8J0_9TELE